VTLIFRDSESFRVCLATGDPAQLAEAYIDGSVDVDGDLEAGVAVAAYLRTVELNLAERLRYPAKLPVPSWEHTVERDTQDVQSHYDLSDDFFRLFLDEKMIYSCAYFSSVDAPEALELAQERKLELICRKLHLRPDDDFLDLGCGWGALALWAAQQHGVQATGTTLSVNQRVEAERRADEAGLAERVRIEARHFVDLPYRAYDAIASVGMIEHVGVVRYPAYFGAVYRALRPGGLFLNQGITIPRSSTDRSGGAFMFRHVFPGAEIGDVPHTQEVMEDAGFEILDVQSLRPHYAMTLREWYRRFRANRELAAQLVPERLVRVWELYLAGCAQAFEDGVVSVHQILAARPDESGDSRAPLVRRCCG